MSPDASSACTCTSSLRATSTYHQRRRATALVKAFQALQQQTVDAHMAFLRVAEQSLRSMEAMLTMGATAIGAISSPAQAAPVRRRTTTDARRVSCTGVDCTGSSHAITNGRRHPPH